MNESGTRCATAGADFRIKIWDAIEGQQIAEFEDTSVVKSVDFSVDAKSIVAGGYSKRLLVFTLSGVSKSPVLAIDHPSVSTATCTYVLRLPCDSIQRIAAREQTSHRDG